MKHSQRTQRAADTRKRYRDIIVLLCLGLVVSQAQGLIPAISSFSPTSGAVGTSVTITGTNFDPVAANNIVFFGGVKAAVTSASSRTLIVPVPPAAAYAPITVTNTSTGLSGWSFAPFTVTFAGGGPLSSSSFAAKVDFPAATNPYGIALGDIDGDGKLEMLVTNISMSTFSVFRNTSARGAIDGSSFASKSDFATGDYPYDIVTADLDGDGKLDVVLTNYWSNTISVFRNTSTQGTISFAQRQDFVAGDHPWGLAVSDLNGDGRPDVVVTNNFSRTVALFRNTSAIGGISFADKSEFSLGSSPYCIAIGDLDGDRKPDLAITDFNSSTVFVLQNSSTPGTIAFAPSLSFIAEAGAYDVAMVDLDGDGKLDLAVSGFYNNTVSMLRNTSAGGAISFADRVNLATGTQPTTLAVGDINGDGKPDIAIANRYGSISVYGNSCSPGAITSAAFGSRVDFSTGNGPNEIALGDIDGDGKPDLAAVNGTDATVSVLRNALARIPLANISALFDGTVTGSRIRINDGGSVNPAANQSAYKISGTSITVEAWVYPLNFLDPALGNPVLVRPLNTTNTDPSLSYGLWITNANGWAQPAFSVSNGMPGGKITVVGSYGLPRFAWTHLAATYDGNALSIYANGMLCGRFGANIQITGGSGVGLYIGRFLSDRFQGAIDEVRLWSVARTQSEILNSMRFELAGNEPGLVGYWKLNTTATVSGRVVVQDQTNNHNDLVVQGSTPMIPFGPTTVTTFPPALSFSPSAVFGGTVEQGTVAPIPVSLTNTSPSPALGFFQVGSASIALDGPSVFFVPPYQTIGLPLQIKPLFGGSIQGVLYAVAYPSSPMFSVVFNSIPLARFDANSIRMMTRRDGRFANDPTNTQSSSPLAGFEWPAGSGKFAIYASGLWIGASVNGLLRTAVASYSSEFAPGPIVNGVAVNPNDMKYRVYKIRRYVTGDADYASWPADMGAPVNADGTPKVIGDQTLFSVYNDLNPANHFLGTQPLGAEVQQTIFGFSQGGPLGNTVFLRFKVINKSSNTWNKTYMALWSDPDLGYYGDDLVGVDVPRNLGFVYNASNNDAVYGVAPPAVGYDFLKGAYYTSPMQSFAYFNNGTSLSDPTNGTQAYNFMQGLKGDGTPYINQVTNTPTCFVYPGDPVTATGWNDTSPADKRFLLSTGPFDLEPGQSKEFIAAIVVGQSGSNLASITALRSETDYVGSLYNAGLIFGGAVENLASITLPSGSSSTLDDMTNAGVQLGVTAGTGGAMVEAATYVGPPPGAQTITTPSLAGVGKYHDVVIRGSVAWPVQIRMYYTRNDLLQAGIVENDLQGVYYWNGSAWKLYSNSGADDQGRGPSTTWVNTTNVTINGVAYEGYIEASAYHLTPIAFGAVIKTMDQRYAEDIQFIQSLPDNFFKKPSDQRRRQLSDMFAQSSSLHASGNLKGAAQFLAQNVTNHLLPGGNSNQDLWITDDPSRLKLLGMVNDIIDLQQRSQSPAPMAGPGSIEAASEQVPRQFALSQNYPNPFNPSTTIKYELPVAGYVSLKVYSAIGEEVANLVSAYQNQGFYQVRWTAQVPSGVYFYRLQAGTYGETKKMILVH